MEADFPIMASLVWPLSMLEDDMIYVMEKTRDILCELEWFTDMELSECRGLQKLAMNNLSVFPTKENALDFWNETESLVETLWVGGMLYSPEILERMSRILSLAADISRHMDVYPGVDTPFGLDYSSYFSSKYHQYYEVYKKAGCSDAFAPLGQKRLDELAAAIHDREAFFDDLFMKYDGMKDGISTPEEFEVLLSDFNGADRRVEILRRLTHEKDMVYGGFSTFDPVGVMKYLMEEIRSDYYGGVYVPLGEDEASYECIVPQLRDRWLAR